MSAPQHERLRELFDRAYELPVETRAAYLDQACGGDDELRRRLQAMLAAAEDVRFLSAPAAAERKEQASSEEGPGTRIGP